MKTVDARGLSCPQPVILTKKTLEESPAEPVEVLVDNQTSVENVSRLAGRYGRGVKVDETAYGYRLTLGPGNET